jgi:hypothetical protein
MDVPGSTQPTQILDWRMDTVRRLVAEVGQTAGVEVDLLRRAHRMISQRVRPVYSLDETRPASRVLRLGRGSCSQRLGVLEAVARGIGIPTRVRGFEIDGRFWYPRFRAVRPLVPGHVLLAWPQFHPDGAWLQFAELFGTLQGMAELGPKGFPNKGGETLFDAVARTAVDWEGSTGTICDVSRFVVADLGLFTDRDTLFATHDRRPRRFWRAAAEPVLGHLAAGGRQR